MSIVTKKNGVVWCAWVSRRAITLRIELFGTA